MKIVSSQANFRNMSRSLHDTRKGVFYNGTYRHRNTHTPTQTERHGDSMTDPAQRAKSVKNGDKVKLF